MLTILRRLRSADCLPSVRAPECCDGFRRRLTEGLGRRRVVQTVHHYSVFGLVRSDGLSILNVPQDTERQQPACLPAALITELVPSYCRFMESNCVLPNASHANQANVLRRDIDLGRDLVSAEARGSFVRPPLSFGPSPSAPLR